MARGGRSANSVQIPIEGDASGLQKALRESERFLKDFVRDTDRLLNQSKVPPGMANEFSSLATQVERIYGADAPTRASRKAALQTQKNDLEGLRKKVESLKREYQQLVNLQDRVARNRLPTAQQAALVAAAAYGGSVAQTQGSRGAAAIAAAAAMQSAWTQQWWAQRTRASGQLLLGPAHPTTQYGYASAMHLLAGPQWRTPGTVRRFPALGPGMPSSFQIPQFTPGTLAMAAQAQSAWERQRVWQMAGRQAIPLGGYMGPLALLPERATTPRYTPQRVLDALRVASPWTQRAQFGPTGDLSDLFYMGMGGPAPLQLPRYTASTLRRMAAERRAAGTEQYSGAPLPMGGQMPQTLWQRLRSRFGGAHTGGIPGRTVVLEGPVEGLGATQGRTRSETRATTEEIKRQSKALKDHAKDVLGSSDQHTKFAKNASSVRLELARLRNYLLVYAFALRPLEGMITRGAQAYVAYQRAIQGATAMGQHFGSSSQDVTQAVERLTQDGLIKVTDAAAGLRNLLSTGVGLDLAEKAMNALKDSAAYGRQGMLDMGEAVVGATDGIKNMISRMVDNAGITKNLSNILDEQAAKYGLVVERMNDYEKHLYILRGVIEESERIAKGDAARLAATLPGQWDATAVSIERAYRSLGAFLERIGLLQGYLRIARDFAEGASNALTPQDQVNMERARRLGLSTRGYEQAYWEGTLQRNPFAQDVATRGALSGHVRSLTTMAPGPAPNVRYSPAWQNAALKLFAYTGMAPFMSTGFTGMLGRPEPGRPDSRWANVALQGILYRTAQSKALEGPPSTDPLLGPYANRSRADALKGVYGDLEAWRQQALTDIKTEHDTNVRSGASAAAAIKEVNEYINTRLAALSELIELLGGGTATTGARQTTGTGVNYRDRLRELQARARHLGAEYGAASTRFQKGGDLSSYARFATSTAAYAGLNMGTPYAGLINQHATQNGLDPALVAAVIEVESAFNPNAVSRTGATGLMQLVRGTARDLGVTDRLSPEQNIAGGTRYLRQMIDRAGSISGGLSAYNGGLGNLQRGVWSGEMRAYAPKVLRAYERRRQALVGTQGTSPQAQADDLDILRGLLGARREAERNVIRYRGSSEMDSAQRLTAEAMQEELEAIRAREQEDLDLLKQVGLDRRVRQARPSERAALEALQTVIGRYRRGRSSQKEALGYYGEYVRQGRQYTEAQISATGILDPFEQTEMRRGFQEQANQYRAQIRDVAFAQRLRPFKATATAASAEMARAFRGVRRGTMGAEEARTIAAQEAIAERAYIKESLPGEANEAERLIKLTDLVQKYQDNLGRVAELEKERFDATMKAAEGVAGAFGQMAQASENSKIKLIRDLGDMAEHAYAVSQAIFAVKDSLDFAKSAAQLGGAWKTLGPVGAALGIASAGIGLVSHFAGDRKSEAAQRAARRSQSFGSTVQRGPVTYNIYPTIHMESGGGDIIVTADGPEVFSENIRSMVQKAFDENAMALGA